MVIVKDVGGVGCRDVVGVLEVFGDFGYVFQKGRDDGVEEGVVGFVLRDGFLEMRD